MSKIIFCFSFFLLCTCQAYCADDHKPITPVSTEQLKTDEPASSIGKVEAPSGNEGIKVLKNIKENEAGPEKIEIRKISSLYFSEPKHEFDEVVEGTEVSHDFKVVNKGAETIHVSKVRTG